MRIDEQIDEMQFRLVNTVEWFHQEFDIPFHAIVGVLEDVKKDYMDAHTLIFEAEIEPEEGESEGYG